MIFFDIYPLVLAVIFVFLIGWLFPKYGKTYDLFKLHLDLFPNWFKVVSEAWAFLTILLSFVVFSSADGVEYFLAVNLNFSMFIFFFSKEKEEDEFSEQLRLKAFFYAFITFVVFIILYGAMIGSGLRMPSFFGEFIFVLIFLGIALFSALLYFNITRYKSSN